MVDSRLHSIYFHAGRLFHTKRYANTKVEEIAAAAGIATGTVYNLFTSKKAILTFVIRASLEDGYLDGDLDLPVHEVDMSILMVLFSHLYNRIFNHIMQITDVDGKICRSFVEMISDIFNMNADTLLATGNIETNANILPQLADEFFPAKEKFMQKMEDNLALYMQSGEIRQLEYPKVHVQSINDILTWWAMNAYIAMPNVTVPRETASKIAIDILARAYLKKQE